MLMGKNAAGQQALKEWIRQVDTVLIGAGAGLSVSAGFSYCGGRFEKYFADFERKYGFHDMYSGGFYPYGTLEEYWAYWSRYIWINRYTIAPKPVYEALLGLMDGKDYFVLTTNVDHCFQRAGFDKKRLFYTQGDYGLWQCARACHDKTYDNEETVHRMLLEQEDMRIPTELIPRCPVCGAPMTMNLRCDDTFVEDAGWHLAAGRYQEFLRHHQRDAVLYLELGVGMNTPGIIKYPFWRKVQQNPKAKYVCINKGQACVPCEIEKQSLCLDCDIGGALY